MRQLLFLPFVCISVLETKKILLGVREYTFWNRDNLMDPETCFIWDGMNREGDGKIDKDWKFTYCQGVVMGAAVEYYKITGNGEHLELARKIACRAVD